MHSYLSVLGIILLATIERKMLTDLTFTTCQDYLKAGFVLILTRQVVSVTHGRDG